MGGFFGVASKQVSHIVVVALVCVTALAVVLKDDAVDYDLQRLANLGVAGRSFAHIEFTSLLLEVV